MPIATKCISDVSMDAIPDEPYDPRVEIMGDLKGKVQKVKLPDLDLIDDVLFLCFHITTYPREIMAYHGVLLSQQ
jgi:hypothetical protein